MSARRIAAIVGAFVLIGVIVWIDVTTSLWQELVVLSGLAAGLVSFLLTALVIDRVMERSNERRWAPVTRLALTEILHGLADDERSEPSRGLIVARSLSLPVGSLGTPNAERLPAELHRLREGVAAEREGLAATLGVWSSFLASSERGAGVMRRIATVALQLEAVRDASLEVDAALLRQSAPKNTPSLVPDVAVVIADLRNEIESTNSALAAVAHEIEAELSRDAARAEDGSEMSGRAPDGSVLTMKDVQAPLRILAVVSEPDPRFDGLFAPIREQAELSLVHDAESMARAASGADALLVWEDQPGLVDQAITAGATLNWVHSASTGVNALITPTLRQSEVTLTNSRGVLDRAIAEYVLGLFIAHRKGFAETLVLQQQRTWRHRTTRMVAGTRAVVVGTGAIGRETARLLGAVGVHVTLVGRRAVLQDPEFGRIAASDDLASEVRDAQLVVLVAPLTAETRHLMSEDVLAAMPRDAYLVNVGRGGLVDEPALEARLAAGQLAGAGLDVFAEEPLPQSSALWGDPRVLVSPHMAGDFDGFEEALVARFVELLRDRKAGRPLSHVVDTRLGYVPSGTPAS